MAKYILSLDAGTTSNQSVLFNSSVEIVCIAQISTSILKNEFGNINLSNRRKTKIETRLEQETEIRVIQYS
jgi:glycerol kinase